MGTIADLLSSPVTKMLLMGDSGSGKTGSVMSLVAAGYNVRVLDLDNGLEILRDYFSNPQSIYRQARPGPSGWTKDQSDTLAKRFHFETVTDRMRNQHGQLVPKAAEVFQKALKLLDGWPELGPISSWTPKDVLVIDSLTFLAKSAMSFQLSMNGRLGQKPWQEDWGGAQSMLDGVLQMLYDDGVNCNVVVMCHMKLYGAENGIQRWYPESLGKALSPNIGRYFNTVLQAKTVRTGAKERRVISTQSSAGLELKTTCPLRVQPEYDLATGLADYFAAARA